MRKGTLDAGYCYFICVCKELLGSAKVDVSCCDDYNLCVCAELLGGVER